MTFTSSPTKNSIPCQRHSGHNNTTTKKRRMRHRWMDWSVDRSIDRSDSLVCPSVDGLATDRSDSFVCLFCPSVDGLVDWSIDRPVSLSLRLFYPSADQKACLQVWCVKKNCVAFQRETKNIKWTDNHWQNSREKKIQHTDKIQM